MYVLSYYVKNSCNWLNSNKTSR